ncbi:MAG TPA: hypothetical protein VJS42_18175 [Steroidobacteraceae bacterium]|nr:hypothetical protein [Steroidobacteraceae bacterium]
MQRLFQTYLDIALWRKGPQDLPASYSVCWFIGLMYVAIALVQVRFMHYSLFDGLALVLVDVGMQAAWLALLLVFFSRMQRFPQTLSAVLGVGILLGALDLLVSSILLFTHAGRDLGYEWGLLKLVFMALVIGRIVTQAIDRGLFTGIALVIAIVLSTEAVSDLILRQL